MSNVSLPGMGDSREASNQGRRSALEMACDILSVLSEGPSKPTHILQKANMSWRVLSSHLEYLLGRGMVEKMGENGARMEYRLTQKGRSILQLYQGLRLSLAGAANVYPTREAFPLVERIPPGEQRERVWAW